MKIYTGRGDRGATSLLGGHRVSKAEPRLDAYGTVDELSSFLGAARARIRMPDTISRLRRVQQDLFVIGASLARPSSSARPRPAREPGIPVERIAEMEGWIDEADAVLPPLRNFILPGGSRAAAAVHLARAVCRRAERVIVRLAAGEEIDDGIIPYLNRLSDYLFVVARLENQAAGEADQLWRV